MIRIKKTIWIIEQAHKVHQAHKANKAHKAHQEQQEVHKVLKVKLDHKVQWDLMVHKVHRGFKVQ
jgi:hypothetical protein